MSAKSALAIETKFKYFLLIGQASTKKCTYICTHMYVCIFLIYALKMHFDSPARASSDGIFNAKVTGIILKYIVFMHGYAKLR